MDHEEIENCPVCKTKPKLLRASLMKSKIICTHCLLAMSISKDFDDKDHSKLIGLWNKMTGKIYQKNHTKVPKENKVAKETFFSA